MGGGRGLVTGFEMGMVVHRVIQGNFSMRKGLTFGFLAAAWAGLLPAMAAGAQDPAGEKAMHDYVLTMSKVKAYDAASSAATAAMKADSSLKAEADKSSNEPDKTFADIKAKFMHHP